MKRSGQILFWIMVAAIASSCQSLRPMQTKLQLQRLWTRQTTSKTNFGYLRMNRMTPIVLGKEIISGNGLDGIVAYNRQSGQEIWRFPVKNGVEAGAQVDGNRIYFGGNDGKFYAVKLSNGALAWQFSTDFEVLGAPRVQDGRVFFIAGNNIGYALDEATGKLLWNIRQRETTQFSVRGGARPAVVGSTVYMGFSGGQLLALNAQNGTVIWERQLSTGPRFKDVDDTPVIDGNYIFISSFDSSLYCLTRSDGQIVWSYHQGGYFPVTVRLNRVYDATTSGKLVALDESSGQLVWSVSSKEGLFTRPVFWNNNLVVGNTHGALEVRSSDDGHLITRFYPGSGIFSTPAVMEDTGEVYFISNDANLYALQLKWINPDEL